MTTKIAALIIQESGIGRLVEDPTEVAMYINPDGTARVRFDGLGVTAEDLRDRRAVIDSVLRGCSKTRKETACQSTQ